MSSKPLEKGPAQAPGGALLTPSHLSFAPITKPSTTRINANSSSAIFQPPQASGSTYDIAPIATANGSIGSATLGRVSTPQHVAGFHVRPSDNNPLNGSPIGTSIPSPARQDHSTRVTTSSNAFRGQNLPQSSVSKPLDATRVPAVAQAPSQPGVANNLASASNTGNNNSTRPHGPSQTSTPMTTHSDSHGANHKANVSSAISGSTHSKPILMKRTGQKWGPRQLTSSRKPPPEPRAVPTLGPSSLQRISVPVTPLVSTGTDIRRDFGGPTNYISHVASLIAKSTAPEKSLARRSRERMKLLPGEATSARVSSSSTTSTPGTRLNPLDRGRATPLDPKTAQQDSGRSKKTSYSSSGATPRFSVSSIIPNLRGISSGPQIDGFEEDFASRQWVSSGPATQTQPNAFGQASFERVADESESEEAAESSDPDEMSDDEEMAEGNDEDNNDMDEEESESEDKSTEVDAIKTSRGVATVGAHNHGHIPSEEDILPPLDDNDSSSQSSIENQPFAAASLSSNNVQYTKTESGPILDKAADGRPYDIYLDSSERIEKTAGALFPRGYKKCVDYPNSPWICAIRSCSALLGTVNGLGSHWNAKHKRCLLNDNEDGTFSIIGSYYEPNERGVMPAIVVSRSPLDPNEPPMQPPRLPSQIRAMRFNTTELGTTAHNEDDPDRVLQSDLPAESATPAESLVRSGMGDEQKIWEYIRPFLKLHKTMPTKNWAKYVAKTPRLRDLEWNVERAKEYPYRDSHARDVTAMIVQVTGEPADEPCKNCRLGRGPFMGCILISPAAPDEAKAAVISCANCYYHSNQTFCCHRFDRAHQNDNEKLKAPPKIVKLMKKYHSDELRDQTTPKPASYNVKVLANKSIGRTGITPDNRPKELHPSVAPPTAQISGFRIFKPSEIQVIEMAAPDRSYKMIRGEGDTQVSMCGCLIPEGYNLDYTIDGRPWICPVRSCRCAFKSIIGLGSHFGQKHRWQLFNDNLDGTISQVGVYRKPIPGEKYTPGLVISRKPLNRKEPPMVEPSIPGLPKPGGYPNGRIGKPTKPASSGLESLISMKGDAEKLWEYMLPYMSNTAMPSEDYIRTLMALPRQRATCWRPGCTKTRLADDPRQVIGLILHLVGVDTERVCTECRRGTGPFEGCYVLPSAVPFEVRFTHRSCANCMYAHRRQHCSTKGCYENPPARKNVDSAAEASYAVGHKRRRNSVDDDGDDGVAARTRRSERLHQIEGEEAREPKKRMVTLPLSKTDSASAARQQDKITTTQSVLRGNKAMARQVVGNGSGLRPRAPAPKPASSSSALISAGQIQLLDVLEMEDWEIAPGRLRATKVEQIENIAFSKAYLASNQTVRVAPNVQFRVHTVRSGDTIHFKADEDNTRMCSLASGKLRVHIDGEPNFTIGPHGMFKIKAGATAWAQNKLYIESVLHVSLFSEGI